MSEQADLFRNTPAQGSLFGPGPDRLQPPQHRVTYTDPAVIRRQLEALLAKAKAAATLPWSETDARMWRIVFPQMGNWLPREEAERLRREFATEMERFGVPANEHEEPWFPALGPYPVRA